MNNKPDKKRSSRLQLLLITLIFVLPLLTATLMYYGGNAARPQARSNHGELLTPIVNVKELLGESDFTAAIGDHWALVYLHTDPCDDACVDALYKQRQTRLMLGNEMSRVVRVWLHGPEAPDSLMQSDKYARLIALHDPAASQVLIDSYRPDRSSGGYYLIDPLGNLVMYFPTEIPPRDLVDDMKHLLKLSSIG